MQLFYFQLTEYTLFACDLLFSLLHTQGITFLKQYVNIYEQFKKVDMLYEVDDNLLSQGTLHCYEGSFPSLNQMPS